MFKRFTLIAMSLFLILTVAAACSNKNVNTSNTQTERPSEESAASPTDEDPFKDHMEISLAYWDIDSVAEYFEQDAVFQTIMKKFNISFKPVNTTWDDYGQKIQMWAASGQLPDIFAIDAIGTQYQRKWVEQGVVKALPDLSQYPNLEKYFETPDIQGLSVDGKHYMVPRRMFPSVDWSVLDRPVYYRWDLAQKAGITKEPETWEEFKAMLKAIVDQDPEGMKTTGLTASTVKMIGGLFWLYGNPAATSDGSGGDFKWIKENGKFIPAVFSDKALPALQNMRDMYTNKLIDPDIALTKPDLAYDKFVAGKAAALLAGGGFMNLDGQIYEKRWKNARPDQNFTESVKVLKPLVGPDGERSHAVFKTYWSESYFNGKMDDKKMARILSLYDYILSPEGKLLLNYGIEGVDYKMEDGKIVMLEEKSLNEKYPAKSFLKELVAYETADVYTMESPVISNKEIRKEAVDYINWTINNSKVPDYNIRLTYMSTPTKDKFSILDHDDLLKVMLSTEPVEKVWEDIVKDYKAKGLDKMIEEVNAKAKEQGIE